MYRLSKRAPQFGPGDRVEVFVGGGATRMGTVTQYHRMPKGGWQYQVQLDGSQYKYWYPQFDVYESQQTLQFQSSREAKASPKFETGEKVKVWLGGVNHRFGNILQAKWGMNKPKGWRYLVAVDGLDGRKYYHWFVESVISGPQHDLPLRQANWIEKSRDMYHIEQKPVGHDRKVHEGPFPTNNDYKDTWLDVKAGDKGKPKYLQGDIVSYQPSWWAGYAPKSAVVRRYQWSPQHGQFYYEVEVDGHLVQTLENHLHPGQGRLFAMRVTAGEVLPFDPSKRKLKTPDKIQPGIKSIPFPAEFAPEQTQEDRDALFYAYDNALNDLRGLYNVAVELGEQSTADSIQAAIDALAGPNRAP